MSGKVLCQYGFNLDDGLGIKAQGIKEPIIPFGTKKKYGWGMKSLVITIEAKAKVKKIMEAVEAEVIKPLTHQRRRVRLESYPIIKFILEKIFLGLPNYFQKKIYMQKQRLFC